MKDRRLLQIAPLPPMDRARQVTDALANYIATAQLQAGDRLPAERELMTALAVGRSTIREAIRHFQALGVIEARKGSGTYLLKPISAATIHMPLSFDPRNCAMHCCNRLKYAVASKPRPAWSPPANARQKTSLSSNAISMRWSAFISRKARQARKIWPFTSPFMTRLTIRFSDNCSNRCGKPFALLGSSVRADRLRAADLSVPPHALQRHRGSGP